MEALTTLRYASVFIPLAKICVTVVVELECLRVIMNIINLWSYIGMYAGQNDQCFLRPSCYMMSWSDDW